MTVAVVTGASRGVGRGIAVELGRSGATVYVTGRTNLDSCAAEIAAAGGTGVAVPLDHRDDAAVGRLFDRVVDEQGRLDLLVNSAFGTPNPWVSSGGFWEHPIALYDGMHDIGVRSTYVASWYAARCMVSQRRGLIVNVSSAAAARYFFSAAYGIAKAATDKLTADTAHELAPHGVTVVSLWPDLVRTEFFHEQVAAGAWPADLPAQDPGDVGRAVLRLLDDPDLPSRAGATLRVAELIS